MKCKRLACGKDNNTLRRHFNREKNYKVLKVILQHFYNVLCCVAQPWGEIVHFYPNVDYCSYKIINRRQVKRACVLTKKQGKTEQQNKQKNGYAENLNSRHIKLHDLFQKKSKRDLQITIILYSLDVKNKLREKIRMKKKTSKKSKYTQSDVKKLI